MTSPALFLLSLALVCSICGIASAQTADHDSSDTMRLPKFDVTMDSPWTTPNKSYSKNNEITEEKVLNSGNNDQNTEVELAEFDKYTMNLRQYNIKKLKGRKTKEEGNIKSRVTREVKDPRCNSFKLEGEYIMHPHNILGSVKHYYNNTDCVTVIDAGVGNVVKLTFVDMFRIEYHPQCAYDYLEIRDGLYGFAKLLGKVCGQAFPKQVITTGPYAWLKFHSDDTIEYEGFKINVEYKAETHSHKIPEACYKTFSNQKKGTIDKKSIDPECTAGSVDQPLDVLWTITTEEENKIYLNFTDYALYKPNECEDNVIQVFGSVIELDAKLVQYCGSVANSVTTKGPVGNIMHVRFFASQQSKGGSKFTAAFNSFRLLNQAIEGVKCREDEFDCEDSTCIAKDLECDDEAQCRLKADEEPSRCNAVQKSAFQDTHIQVILIIFSLILFSMSFVFIFKCVRKLYQDHKIIKEHLRQSTEDRLDTLTSSRLTLDPHKLQRDSEPRASLERENMTNEMYKKKRSFSKHKQSSIDSDFIIETQLDLDEEESWRRELDSMPLEAEDIRIERNGRTRKSDLSKREESMRSKTKETDDSREKKEIRDVSVGAPDTKESACQTRESLFQTDPPPSSDGSGSNSRGFSTFGYSGATIAKPSPPASTKTSEIKIELLTQIPPQETKPQKKTDRRPISTETTRSAPDVIIVSKPIR